MAQDDTATATSGAEVTINVLENDSDPDPDTMLSVSEVSQPANGTAAIVGNMVTYTSVAGFVGTDTFTYTVSDGAATATANVTVTVGPGSPNAPVAGDNTVVTPSGTAVTINVLDNDSDPDGNTLSVSAVSPPANGTATTDGTTVTYTPNAGFVGTDTFTYTVSDGTGNTAMATVMVTVQPGEGRVGANNPDPNVPLEITTADAETPVLQVSVTTGEEAVNLTSTTINATELMGDTTVADMVMVNIINDANGNGQVDEGEEPLASAPLPSTADGTDASLPIQLAFNIPANTTANLLVTLEVVQPTTASLVSPRLPNAVGRMGWLTVLSSVLGLVLCRRLRRRFPRLYLGVVLLLLACSLMLTSCDGDDGGESLTFTPSIPANGIVGAGATTGQPFAVPAAAITGPTVTITP